MWKQEPMPKQTDRNASKPTVLLVGYAKLPEETSAQSLYGTLGVALEVEVDTGIIVAASCTLVPALADDFVSRLLKGVRLSDGVDEAAARIAAHYIGPSQSAIIAALQAAYSRWESYCSTAA